MILRNYLTPLNAPSHKKDLPQHAFIIQRLTHVGLSCTSSRKEEKRGSALEHMVLPTFWFLRQTQRYQLVVSETSEWAGLAFPPLIILIHVEHTFGVYPKYSQGTASANQIPEDQYLSSGSSTDHSRVYSHPGIRMYWEMDLSQEKEPCFSLRLK